MTLDNGHIKFEEDQIRHTSLREEGVRRGGGLREKTDAADALREGQSEQLNHAKALVDEDAEYVTAHIRRNTAGDKGRLSPMATELLSRGSDQSEDAADDTGRGAGVCAKETARRVKGSPRKLKRSASEIRDLRRLTEDEGASAIRSRVGTSGEHEGLHSEEDGMATVRPSDEGASRSLRVESRLKDPSSKKRRGERKRKSPFAGVLQKRALRNAAAKAQAQSAVRAARTAKRSLFGVKAALGAAGAVVGIIMLLFAAVGLVFLVYWVDAELGETPQSSNLPEAVEMWRGECQQACIDVLGDAKWTDLMLAMMAQESGGNLNVLCFPGGVHRQDIMQACEGAYGSWILNGGGPYNLVACTPRASIYAGAAELKQNLSLWGPYLGGIEVNEIEKIELVVQGYNFGAQGWFNWNKRHGYKAYTLEHAQNYSDSVMPAGAKGTPSHAEKVMQYYSWANVGGADGNATVARAYLELGKPYLWGAVGPASYDCSGLVSYCLTGKHERLGTTETFAAWTRVSEPALGDICLNSHHCGIYIGEGKMIHAPHTGDVVKISDVHVGMYYVRY